MANGLKITLIHCWSMATVLMLQDIKNKPREGIHILSAVYALKNYKRHSKGGGGVKRLDEIPVTPYKEEELIVSFTMAFSCSANTYCILTTRTSLHCTFQWPGNWKNALSTLLLQGFIIIPWEKKTHLRIVFQYYHCCDNALKRYSVPNM